MPQLERRLLVRQIRETVEGSCCAETVEAKTVPGRPPAWKDTHRLTLLLQKVGDFEERGAPWNSGLWDVGRISEGLVVTLGRELGRRGG